MELVFLITGVLVFAVFFLPIFQQVLNLGNAAGMLVGILLFAVGLTADKMDFTQKKWATFISAGLLALCVYACVSVFKSSVKTATNEKTVIILGCRVKGDIPSIALEKRVDSAYDFLLCNGESVAVLSGGQGRDENISEALCMKQMLVARGIDESRLFLEERSVNTDQNIRFSKKIIDENNLPHRVAIATSEYHQYRAELICRRYGLESAALNAKTSPVLLPTFLLREAMAVAKEKLITSRIKIE